MSPILLVCVITKLQWTRRYCPLGASLIFESYFPLMNALHFNWFLRRHQFSFKPSSAAADRMLFPTCILLTSPLFNFLLIVSACSTSCVDVWKNMITGDGGSLHYLVGSPIMRLYEASFTFANSFWSPPSGGLLADFSCFIFLNDSASYLSLV